MRARVVIAAFAVCFLVTAGLRMHAQHLPRVAIPDHYDLHLAPNFSNNSFHGDVRIHARLQQPSSSITLNAAEMQFVETTITADGKTQQPTVTFDSNEETVTLTVPTPLPAGEISIAIRYTGFLNDQLRGFYLSQGNGRKYAITQMEPTDARRAFPCFDEPDLKATFSVTATVDEGDTAISNGRIMSDVPGPGADKHTLTFSTSPKMSTYLVALAVGDWACATGSADDIPIRTCATSNHKDQLGFALQAAEFTMKYYNRYFSIKYPFEKLDLLAVPDFAAGAMENAGAIIFRERLLLLDDSTAATTQRKQVADVINHEMAHQWFGDLVTMRWWDDIWLNEGFANWMERKPIEEWHPEWNPQLDMVRETQAAMNIDALASTRSIRTRVETPAEINQVFDALAYQKTGAVVRMVEGYVGPENYRSAISAYLKKFAFGNATGEGYWTTIAQATGKPVDGILSSFITQKSMPLISVTTSCTAGKTHVSLTQKPISTAAPASTTWQVPVCLKRSRNGKTEPAMCEVLSKASGTVTLDGCSNWVFANANSLGYYRTEYGPADLSALDAAFQSSALTPVEQASLIEDVWALVRLNHQNIADFLTLSASIAAAPLNPSVTRALDRIDYISDHFIDPPERPAFERWVRQAVKPIADKLGTQPTPQESEDRRAIRSSALYTLGYAGRDPDILKEARRSVDMQLGNAAEMDPSLSPTYLQLAALTGGEELYDKLIDRMKRASQGRQYQYRNALTYFTDPALQKRTLEFALSPEIRAQDLPGVISGLIARPSSSHEAWEFVKANWDALQKTGVFQGLPTIVNATANFCDQPTRDDVQRFIQSHSMRGIQRQSGQALETIDRCIATREQQKNNLSVFLK
jgi:aminopeptidase N